MPTPPAADSGSEPLRILLAGGHPADAFDNAGGTLAHHARRGDAVTVVVMTHGVQSHSILKIDWERTGRGEAIETCAEELRDEKEAEVRRGCAILGIQDVRFLYYPDNLLLVTEELVLKVADVIREVRPHIVITHHPSEDGGIGTHASCAQITLHAISAAHGLAPDERLKPHNVGQVFFTGTVMNSRRSDSLTALAPAFCDVIVDVTDVVDLKVRALDQIRSQGYAGAYARKRTETVEGRIGGMMRIAYGEAFARNRAEVYDSLPIQDSTIRQMTETSAEQVARYGPLLAGAVPLDEA